MQPLGRRPNRWFQIGHIGCTNDYLRIAQHQPLRADDPFLERISTLKDRPLVDRTPQRCDRGDVAIVTLTLRAENAVRATNAALG
jgi:hypothetical protein